ncbi:PEPxxWA-CTERM sorting domain-containing protein [Sandarakinorhabdus sp. AAP62]|uniref:PEPxxWA-CTERM sorting domain-containing protein n=1 Tax=Sandarakinorhabdus sp. AAP62 TaxID=1248916 RepID=UPI0002DA7A12|nr:PEPxxWA-CTERM sorting domain-containing protein [Sandarakinorhabdus sp. AAP62]
MRSGVIAVAVAALMSTSASAAIQWTDWTSVAGGTATGTIAGATVTMNGPFDTFQVSGGTDYWRTGGNPWAAYDALSNLPGNNDFVAPSGDGVVHTINFSKAVRNPYIAIISLGRPNIQTSWTFGAPFTLIDQGQGFWGNGVFTINGNTISAGEAHGVIQFTGNFTSLTLTTNRTENWSGLTIGTSGVVPEPSSWAMLIAGFGLVGAAARRRRQTVSA